jgi:uncharacterized protein YciI
VQFDQFTVALLILRPDAPQLDEAAAAALQDAHMAHLADLHEAGYLLAAGPLQGDDQFRGLSILKVGPEEARALKEQDPAVRAGRFSVKVLPWLVPAGAISFSSTRFPRSVAEVEGGERCQCNELAAESRTDSAPSGLGQADRDRRAVVEVDPLAAEGEV